MAKHVLNTQDDGLDFLLIGITCLEDQYNVAAIIDQKLKTSFFLSDYIPLHISGGKIFKFSLFRFFDEELGLEYYLVPNSSNLEEPNLNNISNDLFSGVDVDENVKLVKELPKTDYFLLLKGEDLHNYQYKIIDQLKVCPDFIQVMAIEPMDLPSRRNLIF